MDQEIRAAVQGEEKGNRRHTPSHEHRRLFPIPGLRCFEKDRYNDANAFFWPFINEVLTMLSGDDPNNHLPVLRFDGGRP